MLGFAFKICKYSAKDLKQCFYLFFYPSYTVYLVLSFDFSKMIEFVVPWWIFLLPYKLYKNVFTECLNHYCFKKEKKYNGINPVAV